MNQVAVPAPSINLTSFACPVCNAHSTQHWYQVCLDRYTSKDPTPTVFGLEEIEGFEAEAKKMDSDSRTPLENAIKHFRKMLHGEPFIGPDVLSPHKAPVLNNIFVSRCYTCNEVSIWLHDRLLYPPLMTGPAPNPDLSEDVLADYQEARKILDISPRGAAALLRLAIEKICIELGAEGKDIDNRIGFLVAKGLPQEVQQALDAVRVIGNEAVHPGTLDLRDDRETASKLFDLVNFIVQDRVSRPKQISGLYQIISPEKRAAIDKRNAKALEPKDS
jgi:hypothetical protein